jgi:hypothetical protein
MVVLSCDNFGVRICAYSSKSIAENGGMYVQLFRHVYSCAYIHIYSQQHELMRSNRAGSKLRLGFASCSGYPWIGIRMCKVSTPDLEIL